MVIKASVVKTNKRKEIGDNIILEGHKRYCIYDEEPLGFKRDPLASDKRIQAQDPLYKVDLGDGTIKKRTYISERIDPCMKV